MKYLRPLKTNTLDDVFDSAFSPFLSFDFGERKYGTMRTDITEREDSYLFEIDLAGYPKENIGLNLDKGYLTVSAKDAREEESKEKGYIRKERTSGSCSRTYYVGDVTEKDIKAKYEQGVLTLTINKESKKPDTAKQISIE